MKTKGNSGEGVKKIPYSHAWTTEMNQPAKHGPNINTYKGMTPHGEGGMDAPGECPLTVAGSRGTGKPPMARPPKDATG